MKFIRDMLHSLFTFASVPSKSHRPSASYIVTLCFLMNFVGIVFARSMHYQFYVWYFHTLPWLLYVTPLPNGVRLGLLVAIEYCWNVFPATPISSGLLALCHGVLLIALLVSKRLPEPPSTTPAIAQTQAKKVR